MILTVLAAAERDISSRTAKWPKMEEAFLFRGLVPKMAWAEGLV